MFDQERYQYDQERYQLARARVQQLLLFYIYVVIYVFVNILLRMLNLLTDPSSLWFYWPLLGWGIALGANAFLVYGAENIMGKEWEKQKMRQILEEEEMQELEQEKVR
jgi:hypothetical protein